MSNLRERIEAEMARQIEELATLSTSPPFVVEVDMCTCYGGKTVYGHERGCGSDMGPGWWIVDAFRRQHTHYRRVLERHKAIWPSLNDPNLDKLLEIFSNQPTCLHGRVPGDLIITPVAWPCPEVRDVAEALGISLVEEPA